METFTDQLVLSARGPIRLLELNRPERRNAAGPALHTALARIWSRLAEDDEARVVVLTGRGKAFSAGGDFDVMTTVQTDVAVRDRTVREARQIITDMIRCRLPIVAAVNGPAVGLGCSLALLSDLVLIAENAYLADPHVQVGLVAGDGGALVLPLLVGLPRAKQLLFLGERVDAEQAVRLGIANRVVPADTLLGEALELADRLAALPAQALQDTKRAINLHLEQAMAGVLEPALLAERESMQSADHLRIVADLVARNR